MDEEVKLSNTFRKVVELHDKLGSTETVRFSAQMTMGGNLGIRGEQGTFWQTASLWQVCLRP